MTEIEKIIARQAYKRNSEQLKDVFERYMQYRQSISDRMWKMFLGGQA